MNDSRPAKPRSHRFLVSVSVALGDIMWLAGDGASARASGMRARRAALLVNTHAVVAVSPTHA